MSDLPDFPPDHCLLVLNPVSGRGRGVRHRQEIEAMLADQGLAFESAVSAYAGHTTVLVADAVRRGCRRVLVAGGDGSLNEAVNGLFGQQAVAPDRVTLALLPVGTGNDWGRGHGLARDMQAAIALAAGGRSSPHDVGVIEFADGGRRHFINVAGCGFDSTVVARMPSRRFGRLAYLVGLLRGLAAYRPLPLDLEVAGRRRSVQTLVVFACLGRYCGGGMDVAPDARTDDGLMDLTVIRHMNVLQILRDLPRLFDGTLPAHPRVDVERTAEAVLAGPEGTLLEADGDIVGRLPARLRVIPGALRVVLPG
ncbi:MAG: diacylglycerol kinase family lipid kinase [Rhodocyclaceae bacterium]|nr:diacylglycerol kinase family lipid kinase [Rhodocyclaceae bacterium]